MNKHNERSNLDHKRQPVEDRDNHASPRFPRIEDYIIDGIRRDGQYKLHWNKSKVDRA